MALAILLALAAAQAPASAPIEGRWRSPGGNSIIAVAPCGHMLCGTVAWASERAKKDAARTTDQLVGTQILTGVRQRGEGRWQGRLFIPDKNMRVSAKIQLESPTQLRVSGCLAGKSLCRATIWTRVEGPLPGAN